MLINYWKSLRSLSHKSCLLLSRPLKVMFSSQKQSTMTSLNNVLSSVPVSDDCSKSIITMFLREKKLNRQRSIICNDLQSLLSKQLFNFNWFNLSNQTWLYRNSQNVRHVDIIAVFFEFWNLLLQLITLLIEQPSCDVLIKQSYVAHNRPIKIMSINTL